ncbi:MAG: AAA family ATPase [Candidatus Bathyarchaeia archaeon]
MCLPVEVASAMNLFQEGNGRILRDAKWLQPLSDPPGGKPLCRDGTLRAMAHFLSEVFAAGQARNLFIYGGPGTGKTACVRYLLQEIRRKAEAERIPVAVAYVNAGGRGPHIIRCSSWSGPWARMCPIGDGRCSV